MGDAVDADFFDRSILEFHRTQKREACSMAPWFKDRVIVARPSVPRFISHFNGDLVVN
jgi:predicted ATPase